MIDDSEPGAAMSAASSAQTTIMALVVGPLGREYAGEAWTVQRAAFVSEAQQYRVTTIPPLLETLAELHADLVRADEVVRTAAPKRDSAPWAPAGSGDAANSARTTAVSRLEGATERRPLDCSAVLARGAWLGPRLVGSVRGRVEASGTAMEVARFAVAPDLQGRGIGRRLLIAIHAAAPPSVRTFWLVAAAQSHDNLRFYAAAGYRVTGRLTDPDGIELVRMEQDSI